MDLLGRFSVLSLAATLVLGLVLAVTVRGQIKDRAIENAGQSALLIARFGIQPQLTDSDVSHGLDGKKIAALDEVLHDGYTTGSVKTIKVWNTSGTVIYSNDHKVIGDHDGKDEGFLAALRGAVHAEVSGGVDEEGESDEGRVLESYVPLAVGSDHDIDGVFELYSDYAPVAAGIRRDERRVFLLLGLGLLALYAILFKIVAGASRRLRRQADESLQQARHDSLTGLSNRGWMYEQIESVLDARRPTGVMVMDLDRFKSVNDSLGHRSGDLLLQICAERLRGAVRESDTVARLGGDEFAVLLPDADRETADAVALRAHEAFSRPFRVDGVDLDVRVSVGVALFPADSDTVDGLLHCADLAMYAAKETGEGPLFATPLP